MLVGSHGVSGGSERAVYGAQMIWRKADGLCGHWPLSHCFCCYWIPSDLIPANNWICTMTELWNCECAALLNYFCRLYEVFWFLVFITDLTDIQTHFYTNAQVMNTLIGSWHAGEVEAYILSAFEADWNPAQQQMPFYCESDPVVTFRKKVHSLSLSWLLNCP